MDLVLGHIYPGPFTQYNSITLMYLIDLLGLSKKYPYLKQALSQKTCFLLFRLKIHENAHIFPKMHSFYAN